MVLSFGDSLISATENIKRRSCKDFLLKVASNNELCLAMVLQKRAVDKKYIELRVDSSFANKAKYYFNDFKTTADVGVNFFDSMTTRIREFRTIRCAEFFEPHGKYLLDPSLLSHETN